MNVSQVPTEEATPEFVLAVIQDSHRQQCYYDPEADPDVALDFESTVGAWREACDLIGWRPLGRALNREFRLNYCDDEWQTVLEPADNHTLYQVCLFIAVRARQPTLRPITILGASCLRAAAFRAVQDVLHNAGADVRSLRPSTPLAS